MIRTQESTGKTVDEARAKACALLGVQADDLNVSYEVLEMPQKTGFLGLKTTPAKVRVSVELPDAPAAAPAKPVEVVAEQPVETAAPVQETAPVAEEVPAAVEEPAAEQTPVAEQTAETAEEAEEVEVPIVIEENAKVKAAVDYLREVITLMGVENVTFSAVQKGEATIIRLDGEKLGALIGRFTGLHIDGWVGVIVAVFILRAGWGAAKDTLNPLLGQSPDPDLVQEIRQTILVHPQVIGIHDLIIHDYGPGRSMMSLHAEVPVNADIMETHDVIDAIERELKAKFGIETSIHMDPIVTDDERVNRLHHQVAELVRGIDPKMTIHDFRITAGPHHTNLIFDVVVPHCCSLTDDEVRGAIARAVKELDKSYYTVIQVDRSYV